MWSERLRKWTGAFLFLSLAVNLFLGGVLLGRITFAPRDWDLGTGSLTAPDPREALNGPADQHGDQRATPTGNRLAERLRALPAAERRRFMTAFLQNRGDLPQARRELRLAALHVAELIAAPTFDQAALTQALADVRAATAHEQASLHAALVPALATLSPESRASLADNRAQKNP